MATRKLRKTLIFHHFEFFWVKCQGFFRSKNRAYTILVFMFMGGDWKQLYTPDWIKIILLVLTKCSIVHHVGLQKSYYYWMPNCTPCLMWDILLLLQAQIWVMGGTCSKLPRAIQLGQDRKVGHKAQNLMEECWDPEENRSKQAATEGHKYVHIYSYYSGDSSEVELHGKFIMQVSMRKDVLLVCQAGI